MHILRFFFVSIVTLAAFAGASGPAAAAESYDSCLGFIDALPATITTQGTWCLRQNLDTSATSGNAIEIQTNNVTIDCNGFRMRGSGGGASTTATGIFAAGRLNITIRHCTIRGFSVGIQVTGGSGYLVEDNLLDQSRFVGITIVGGAGSVIRRNIVTNSGGAPASSAAYGIYADGDVIDNVVDGAAGADSLVNFWAYGIYSPGDTDFNFGIVIQGNRIRNLAPKGTGTGIGISSNGRGVSVRDNAIGQASLTTGFGIACADNTSHVRDNVILKYATGIAVACDDAGNGIGIVVNGSVDAIDNVVDGVTGDGSVAFTPYGITAGDNNSVGSLIRGNRVRNLTPNGSGSATGILVYSTGAWVRDNLVGQQSSTNGIGISCGTETRVRDNIVKNYTQGLAGLCDNDTGNVAY